MYCVQKELGQACNQNSAARGAMIFLGGAITYNKFSYGQLKYKKVMGRSIEVTLT